MKSIRYAIPLLDSSNNNEVNKRVEKVLSVIINEGIESITGCKDVQGYRLRKGNTRARLLIDHRKNHPSAGIVKGCICEACNCILEEIANCRIEGIRNA